MVSNAPLRFPPAEPSIMGMPQTTERWTAERVRALPDDGRRHEAVDGVLLVTPSPGRPHQRAVLALVRLLDPFVREHRVGELVLSPADVELDAWTLVQPDLFVEADGRLLLAIEVISPSSAQADRHLKRRRYQAAGIPQYWIVDPDARRIERWRPGAEAPDVVTGPMIWEPAAHGPCLTLDPVALFEDVWR